MSKFTRGVAVAVTMGALALTPIAVSAMGSSSSDDSSSSKAKPSDAAYDRGVAAVEAQNWKTAITNLELATAKDPGNADAFNYLGYAYRKSGNYLDALSTYRKALDIDPEHKGAHEYIGQAYLEIGNLGEAEKHLAALD